MSNYRKTMTEALQEMYSLDESVIDKVKEIASKKAAKKIDGVMVDSFTASAISQIYDKVNDANKKKMEKLPITKLADLAFKMMQKNEFVPEEVDLDEKVKEYKGVAYFKDRKDAEAHMKKYAPKGRIREYDRGYAIQTKIAGPYLNKSGKTEEADLDEASARADARRSMRADPDMRQKFSKDVSATDDDIKGASKNIMMQMRKAQSLGRGMGDPKRKFKVEFGDGKKVEIPVKVAMAVQQKFNSMRKPADKEKFQSKVAKSYKDMLRALKEEVELDEAKYDLYHKDFSSAMQHAYKMAKKLHGITVDPKEIDDKVASGPKKPSEGKTNSYRLKGDKGAIQVQVYNKGGSKPFELNMYKEEVELGEKLDKEDEPKVKEIIKKLKGASQAHAGQAKDLQKAVTEKDELDEAEAYSPKQIKMAIGIASDPRYKGGNYSGAVKAIEKIKGGLSQHKQVAAVLKRQNEALGENLDGRTREYRQHRERLESLRSKRLEARHIDPADIDTSATDDDIKSADKNIMMQLRKSVSLRGQYSVEFLDKKKVKVPQKIALAVIAKYNSLKKPMDKEKFQAKVAKSHRDLLMGLKENLDEKKKKDKIKIGEESTLDRMNKKLQEKKNG